MSGAFPFHHENAVRAPILQFRDAYSQGAPYRNNVISTPVFGYSIGPEKLFGTGTRNIPLQPHPARQRRMQTSVPELKMGCLPGMSKLHSFPAAAMSKRKMP